MSCELKLEFIDKFSYLFASCGKFGDHVDGVGVNQKWSGISLGVMWVCVCV